MIKYLYFFLVSLLLVFLHQSIFSSIVPDGNINIIIVFLVFITFVWGLDYSFNFAVMVGFLQGFYSILPFGIFIIFYLAVIVSVDYLHRQIFINFTFTTNLLLIISSTLIFSVFIVLSIFLFRLTGLISVSLVLDIVYLNNLIWQTINNIILGSFVYIVAKAVFKKLNFTILIKR